ncbi:hypothetical protein [Chitinimonas koreensis]|uniref:hypothetical protein n=1 Tax=Chitinimonas koreensis TaxID=356302 RepID=UPI0012FAE2F5|nr:hypothetical protein [Chitinimonas koreensis]QNM96207.1 hypothetical protein H9L41_20745 [Chitinimonas koreensis]
MMGTPLQVQGDDCPALAASAVPISIFHFKINDLYFFVESSSRPARRRDIALHFNLSFQVFELK